MIEELLATSQQLAKLLDTHCNVPIVSIDEQLRITDCNSGFLIFFSLSKKPCGAVLSDFLIPTSEKIDFIPGDLELTCNPKTGVHGILMVHRVPYNKSLLLWCERLQNTDNQVVEQMSVLNNEFIVIQRELAKKNQHLKRIQHELEEKVYQLEQALSQIKQLEGIIPICMYCKNIRDDKESWHQVERYISDHTEAEFSHGICPVCFEKHYGDNSKTIKEVA